MDVATNNSAPDDPERRDGSSTPGVPGDAFGAPDFGSFMRQVFPESRPAVPEVSVGVLSARAQNASLLRRDYETAFTLLQRASEAVPALLRHCQQLEADMRRLREDALAEVRSAQGETQQWQQVAVAMKMHIDQSEHQIAIMRKRLAAAEDRLAAGQTLAKAAEQQANLAIGITTLFHDKIVDAFGVGSPAHAALDAIAQGALPAPTPLQRDHH